MLKSAMKSLQVYSREGCHLCEQLLEELLPLVRGTVEIEVIDIDRDARWQAEFGTRIPVVEFEGQQVCQYTLDAAAIQQVLAGIPRS